MAVKNPICNYSGELKELQSGDTLPSASVDIQEFTANGTWTKPAGAKLVRFYLLGAGGGGGGGGRYAVNTASSGGSGGGGGLLSCHEIQASALPDTLTVTIGSGSNGGAAAAADSSNGGDASTGGSTLIVRASPSATLARAYGGGGGVGGTNTTTQGAFSYGSLTLTSPAIVGSYVSSQFGQPVFQNTTRGSCLVNGNGQSSSVSGAPTAMTANYATMINTGGAAGGSITSANNPQNSGFVHAIPNSNNVTLISAQTAKGGGTGAAGDNGTEVVQTATNEIANFWFRSQGGGGGAAGNAGATIAGTNGGNGGRTAGGGGGGASRNGSAAGAGGRGGDGYALIITFC